MGIDLTTCDALLRSIPYVKQKNRLLTLGRQHIDRDISMIRQILDMYGLNNHFDIDCQGYSENFFKKLGFLHIDSLDCSNYENASIIYDLNQPISKHSSLFTDPYNFIFDGGTIEHIFNTSVVCQNIVDLLDVGGIFCSVTCNNNFSGHGFYQFSPEFFLRVFQPKYGMKVHEMYLAKNDTLFYDWIPIINNFHTQPNFRMQERFFSNDSVYIITIAEKISQSIYRYDETPPYQFSYEENDWIK